MMAFILAATGVLLIFGVLFILNGPPPPTPVWHRARCDSTSPDGLWRCRGLLAHTGWCYNGELEWRYESWAIGHDDETRAEPHPETQVSNEVDETEGTPGRVRRIPKKVFWAGLALIAWTGGAAIDAAEPPEAPKPVHNCEWWSGISCKSWVVS